MDFFGRERKKVWLWGTVLLGWDDVVGDEEGGVDRRRSHGFIGWDEEGVV